MVSVVSSVSQSSIIGSQRIVTATLKDVSLSDSQEISILPSVPVHPIFTSN
jgi:hypothetical protein